VFFILASVILFFTRCAPEWEPDVVTPDYYSVVVQYPTLVQTTNPNPPLLPYIDLTYHVIDSTYVLGIRYNGNIDTVRIYNESIYFEVTFTPTKDVGHYYRFKMSKNLGDLVFGTSKRITLHINDTLYEITNPKLMLLTEYI